MGPLCPCPNTKKAYEKEWAAQTKMTRPIFCPSSGLFTAKLTRGIG
ncbi:unnamed protein product [Staurois parvus]|uniref:Uncharacterized protein n=1 Tax=Staurois parvus TaxID=386267 RepID=A0ABN9E8U2_9NEOB|nr:unnamed protein product [Staurois parvus]